MALCGSGAMILYYDIAPNAIEDHDDWHSHEHFPERLSIPGFLRASRWVAAAGSPRYLVMYEVADVQVLSDAPYLERLNNPTPWTARMMANFRGKDAEIPWVLLVTGYNLEALARIADDELCVQQFKEHGGSSETVRGKYRLDFSLTDRELAPHA
jgi:hypothetical protein